MPWWSWLLIWSALILVFVGVLVWFAFTFYRTVRHLMLALEALSDQVVAVDIARASLAPEKRALAVFADPALLLYDVEQRRADRAHRRQVRRDARIVRGKLVRNAR
jgi:hypothetical protein